MPFKLIFEFGIILAILAIIGAILTEILSLVRCLRALHMNDQGDLAFALFGILLLVGFLMIIIGAIVIELIIIGAIVIELTQI